MGRSESSELKAVNGTKDRRVADVLKDRYFVVDTKVEWNKAKAACETWGAHLATLTAYADVEKVKKMMDDGAYYWIGAQCPGCTKDDINKRKAEKWEWLTGERLPLHFRYWRKSDDGTQQPHSTGKSNYLAMYRKGSEVVFYNDDEEVKCGYVCQSP